MKITQTQLEQVNDRMQALIRSNSFYGKKLEAAGMTEVHTPEEFAKLPFSEKKDLRDAYPLGLMAVPEEEVVRIHSSSGTTGTPVIIPYTAKDVDDWAIQFKRCYETAGITKKDRIQITPGYGEHRAVFHIFLCVAAGGGNWQTWHQGQDSSEKGCYRFGALESENA